MSFGLVQNLLLFSQYGICIQECLQRIFLSFDLYIEGAGDGLGGLGGLGEGLRGCRGSN